jgi:hypothetical protein
MAFFGAMMVDAPIDHFLLVRCFWHLFLLSSLLYLVKDAKSGSKMDTVD